MIEAARQPFAAAIGASEARYAAWLYATAEQRPVMELYLALEHELTHTVRPGADHTVAHARLEWWEGEAARTAVGTPAHPITQAIVKISRDANIDPPDLRALVETLAWDLAGAPCASAAEFAHYLSAWASSWWAPLAGALLRVPTTAAGSVGAVGAALRELQLLARAHSDPELCARRIPGDALTHAGATRESLTERPLRPPAYNLLADRHRAARGKLATHSASLAPASQQALRPLLVWIYCEFIDSQNAVAALPGPYQPGPWAHVARTLGAWRAALTANAGRFALPGQNEQYD